MKKLFIIATWKSHKTTPEAIVWLQEIANKKWQNIGNKELIVCPPFPLLSTVKAFMTEKKLPFKIGAQDISPFDEGPYTGAVNGKQIKEFADYVIIGHSERRTHFNEDEETLELKVQMALKAGLTPIYCVQGKNTPVPKGVTLVAYEPVSAIGNDHPDNPADAETVAAKIKEKHKIPFVLYGGSVAAENVTSFTHMADIDGVLVSTHSLDPKSFIKIVDNA